MTVSRFISVLALALVLSAPAMATADPAASMNEAVHQPTTVPESAAEPAAGTFAAAHESAVATETAEHKGLPQLNIHTYPSQIFWLLIMFAVLYVAFSKSILPSIGSVVNARDSMIKGNLDDAEKLKQQAQAIQAAYEKNLEQARAQAVQAVQDVENAAKKKSAEQVDAFRKRADGELQSAEDRVLGVKDQAMGQMTGVAAEVASLAAEKITGISTDRAHAHTIVQGIAGKAKAA